MVTLELLGMGIASRHHRRVLGDAQIRPLKKGIRMSLPPSNSAVYGRLWPSPC
jgi:hypothetical protein